MSGFSLRFFASETKSYAWAALTVTVLFFCIFKLFYPHPNMVMDSYVYLNAAVLDLGANIFPIGYSEFLRGFLFFSRSTAILAWFQYIILESASLILFLTLIRRFQPYAVTRNILFVFLFCNPLFIFLSNFIMSDGLFTAVSILWITLLVHIITNPTPRLIWFNAGLIFLAFSLRYNAIYYPVISTVFIVLSRLKIQYKVVGIVLQIFILGVFILYTRGQMNSLMGVNQFSPLGGWHMANNALYMYSHTYAKRDPSMPAKFRSLDSLVTDYFSHTKDHDDLLHYDDGGGGAFYLANYYSPLLKYMHWRYGPDTAVLDFKKWGPMGAVCSSYSGYLIRKEPMDYLYYYVWPNTIRYIIPPGEIFVKYSPYYLREDEYSRKAVKCFNLTTLSVPIRLIKFRNVLLSQCSLLFGALNLIFILCFFGFCFLHIYRKISTFNNLILGAVLLVWIFNFFFSVVAASVVLRYEIFVLIVLFVFDALIIDIIYRNNVTCSNKEFQRKDG